MILCYRSRRWRLLGAVIGIPVGAAVAVVAAPLVVAGMGFGAGGIVAGSYAASMMSAAAIANGGAVAAGSSVAILQSIGAAGFGLAGLMGVGAAGAAAGAGVGAVVGAGADVVMDGMQNNGDAGDAGGNSDAGSDGIGMKPMGQQPNAAEADSDVKENKENQTSHKGATASATVNEDSAAMGKVELIIMDSFSNNHSFMVTWDELLCRVFKEFLGKLGLASGAVRFELNGMQIFGDHTLRMINWKIGDVVDAMLL